jgi:hypothetical protein
MSDSPVILDLIVITPFGPYNRGDAISDPAAIAAVLLSNPDDVVQILQDAGQPTGLPTGQAAPPDDPPPPPVQPSLIPNGAGTTFVLSVTTPFGDYNRGDQITDPDAIADALQNNPDSVVMTPAIPGTN